MHEFRSARRTSEFIVLFHMKSQVQRLPLSKVLTWRLGSCPGLQGVGATAFWFRGMISPKATQSMVFRASFPFSHLEILENTTGQIKTGLLERTSKGIAEVSESFFKK